MLCDAKSSNLLRKRILCGSCSMRPGQPHRLPTCATRVPGLVESVSHSTLPPEPTTRAFHRAHIMPGDPPLSSCTANTSPEGASSDRCPRDPRASPRRRGQRNRYSGRLRGATQAARLPPPRLSDTTRPQDGKLARRSPVCGHRPGTTLSDSAARDGEMERPMTPATYKRTPAWAHDAGSRGSCQKYTHTERVLASLGAKRCAS